MILTFADKSGSSLKKNADLIIKDTIVQSQLLEDLLQEAPAILEGYAGFRKILRAIKRGDSLDKAILNNCLECCPPNTKSSPLDISQCGVISCNNCWKNFITNYSEAVLRKK